MIGSGAVSAPGSCGFGRGRKRPWRGLTIAAEYHEHTLTDTNESAARFIDEVGHPSFRTYWQPPAAADHEYCSAGPRLVHEKLAALHVFHPAGIDGRERRPLAEGADRWREYLRIASAGPVEWAFLEFVRGDSLEKPAWDPRVLEELLREDGTERGCWT